MKHGTTRMGTGTRTTTRIGGTLLAGLLFLAGPAGARQEAREDAATPLAWEGTPQDGAALRAEIAAARVALDVEADFEALAARLDALWLRAAEVHGFEGQGEALVEIALARAELARRLGKREQALEELQRLLPVRAARADVRLVPASSRLVASLANLAADPRIAGARARIESGVQAAAGGDDPMRALVEELYAKNDVNALGQLGAAAFERLAELLRADVQNFPTYASRDPLLVLVKLDQRRAARWLMNGLGQADLLWKKRVLRAMTAVDVLEDTGTWTTSQPYVCLEPEWIELVDRLLGEPATAVETVPFLASIERRDGLTPALATHLARALTSYEPTFATAAMRVFDHSGVVSSARPVLEAALGLEDASLRRFAAGKLENFVRSDALLAHADDPDAEVQRSVARTLESRYVYRYSEEGIEKDYVRPDWHPECSAAVARLLTSPFDDVRASATARLSEGPTAPAKSVLEACLKDPSPSVRRNLAYGSARDPEVHASVLLRLAEDPDAGVVDAVDQALDNACDSGWLPGPYVETLTRRLRDAKQPLDAEVWGKISRRLFQSTEGVRALVTLALAVSSEDSFAQINRQVSSDRLLALPDELLARLLMQDRYAWDSLWGALSSSPTEHQPVLRILLSSSDAPREVRARAARLVGIEPGPGREALLRLLHDPSWKEQRPSGGELASFAKVLDRSSRDTANSLALTFLRDPALHPEIADALVSGFDPDGPGAEEIAAGVLERWLRPAEPWRSSVAKVLESLATWPELATAAVVERFLARPEYNLDVIERVVGTLADPSHLPLLLGVMRGQWPAHADDRVDQQVLAARALGAFDDERAVEALLAGLRASTPVVRQACQESLDRLRTFRAAARDWTSEARALPSRTGAASELVALLADPDASVRGHAARGLAALGAVEAIPSLIRLLKDADASVRAAAEEALERLQTAPTPVEDPETPR